MGRLWKALLVAGLIGLMLPADASAAPEGIVMLNFVFAPNPARLQLGQQATWRNEPNDNQHHTATDNSPLALWDSGDLWGGQTYSFTFTAAATYSYECTLHYFFGMVGTVVVRDNVSPPSGPVGTVFTIAAATVEAPVGMVYDIQKGDPDGRFRNWIVGTTVPSAQFDSTGHLIGTYRFRSRLRRVSDDAATGYSPAASIDVTS